jgi:hypothetical protein
MMPSKHKHLNVLTHARQFVVYVLLRGHSESNLELTSMVLYTDKWQFILVVLDTQRIWSLNGGLDLELVWVLVVF